MVTTDELACPSCGAPKPVEAASEHREEERTSRSPGAPISIGEVFARLVGFTNFRKSHYFHVAGEGEAPYDAHDVAIHRTIVRFGKAFGAFGVLVAVGFLVSVLFAVGSGDQTPRRVVLLLFSSLIVAAAIPVLAYFFGTSVGLLFAPSGFLGSPIGRKWLKIAGVKSIAAARTLCLAVLIGLLGIIAAVTFVALNAS